MTAAHCLLEDETKENFKSPSSIVARLGIAQTGEARTDLNTYLVSEIHLHPSYQPKDETKRFDIAVIKLIKNVTFSSKIKPACLSLDDEIDDYLVGSGKRI